MYAGVNDRSKLDAKTVQKRRSVLLRTYENSYYSVALIKVNDSFILRSGVEMASVTTYGVKAVEDNICNSGSYGVQPNNVTAMKYIEFELGACKCHGWLKKNYPKEIEDDWVCRQNEGVVKICQGDFGLGMMCDGTLQAICIGVVFLDSTQSCSTINGNLDKCEQKNSMGLFIDLCYYIDWIGSFVSSIEKARLPCSSKTSVAPNTPTPRWLTFPLLLAFAYVCERNFIQR